MGIPVHTGGRKDPPALTKKGVYLRNFDSYRGELRRAAAQLLLEWRKDVERFKDPWSDTQFAKGIESCIKDFRAFIEENL